MCVYICVPSRNLELINTLQAYHRPRNLTQGEGPQAVLQVGVQLSCRVGTDGHWRGHSHLEETMSVLGVPVMTKGA